MSLLNIATLCSGMLEYLYEEVRLFIECSLS